MEAKEREKENINSSVDDIKQTENISSQNKIDDKMSLASKEDAYVFKEEDESDFEPTFRSLHSERRKSHTLKETQCSLERRRGKRRVRGHNEDERLSLEEPQPTEKGMQINS